jgi:hypothetical protein
MGSRKNRRFLLDYKDHVVWFSVSKSGNRSIESRSNSSLASSGSSNECDRFEVDRFLATGPANLFDSFDGENFIV